VPTCEVQGRGARGAARLPRSLRRGSLYAFKPGTFEVVGAVPGNATTDFGAPDRDTPWDDEAITSQDLKRQVAVLVDCWTYFDGVVDACSGDPDERSARRWRDRDGIVSHVKRPKRHYCSKLVRACPRERHGSNSVRWSLRHVTSPIPTRRVASRYSLRRLAWHVLDHAWRSRTRGVGPF